MGTEDIVFGPQSPAAIQRKIEMAKAAGEVPPGAASPPAITMVKPNSGPDQTEFVITGDYFQMQGEGSQVMVGKEAAVILGWTRTELTLVAVQGSNLLGPPCAVQVIAADGQTSGVTPGRDFTFEPAKAAVGGKKDAPHPVGKKPDLSLVDRRQQLC